MIKIQKANPVSLKLMDLANAGVAIRMVNPIINPVNLGLFSLNTPRSPFLQGSILPTDFMCTRETKNQICEFYTKRIFFCQYLSRSSFLVNSFSLFKNPMMEPHGQSPCPHAEVSQVSARRRRVRRRRTKSYLDSCVDFREFALGRSLRIMAWMVTVDSE